MTLILKFIHLAAIAVWSGGLIALPFLFRQRQAVAAGPDLDRLHRLTRFVYVDAASPAAFVAIASGTVLIFAQATFIEWFSLKMLLVAALAMLHVAAGLVLHQLFAPGGRFGRSAAAMLAGAYAVVIIAILWVVLAKPQIESTGFAAHFFAPGGLGRAAASILGRN